MLSINLIIQVRHDEPLLPLSKVLYHCENFSQPSFRTTAKGQTDKRAFLRIAVSGLLYCFLHLDEYEKADVSIYIKHFIRNIGRFSYQERKLKVKYCVQCLDSRYTRCLPLSSPDLSSTLCLGGIDEPHQLALYYLISTWVWQLGGTAED